MITVGQALRRARMEAGLSQAAVGGMLGVTKQYVSLIETGRNPLPDSLLKRLPRPLRVSVAEAMVEILESEMARLRAIAEPEKG